MGFRAHSIPILIALLIAGVAAVSLAWLFLEDIGYCLIAVKCLVNERRRQARQRRAALRYR